MYADAPCYASACESHQEELSTMHLQDIELFCHTHYKFDGEETSREKYAGLLL